MAIAYQPAMTAEAVRMHPPAARPEPRAVHDAPGEFARSAHSMVLVDEPLRAWTVTKIIGLVAITAISAAVAVAVVAGGVLFAILTIS